MTPCFFPHSQAQSGFSLVELLGTVAIGGIMAASLATTDFSGPGLTEQLAARTQLISSVVDQHLVVDGDLHRQAVALQGDLDARGWVLPQIAEPEGSPTGPSDSQLAKAAASLSAQDLIGLLISSHQAQDELLAIAAGRR